jgi:FAD:protein FMN transferase
MNTKKIFCLCLGISVVLFVGCKSIPEKRLSRFQYAELHMATIFRITFYTKNKTNADAAAVAAFERINALENIMSDYDPRSELMELCRKPVREAVTVSADLFRILQISQKISRQTEGAFDVTVGPFVQLWRTARKKKILPTQDEILEARKSVGWQKIKLDSRSRSVTLLAPNMKLDLGGIAKGFAADEALKVLKAYGISRAMVAASGDIVLADSPPKEKGWRIGVGEMDSKTNQSSQILFLHNCGISTSGDTEQFIEINKQRFAHIVDPRTGLGLTNRIQATVIARDGTHSDSLATAVCILGVDRGLAIIDSTTRTSVLVQTKTDSVEKSFSSRQFRKERLTKVHSRF